ncbi:MAG: 30S ribosomal protein S20 [Nitrospiria bacterium]
MANHPSALKRERQAQKRRVKNRAVNSRIKTSIRKLTAAIDENNIGIIEERLKEATSTLDRAASKGVIPKKRASRKVSRLSAKANKVFQDQTPSE